MSVKGECASPYMQPGRLANRVGMVRNCVAGARYYPHSDAMTLPREVYRYLRETATNIRDAKTKESISAALSCHSHSNVSHVVEALKALGYVAEPDDHKTTTSQRHRS